MKRAIRLCLALAAFPIIACLLASDAFAERFRIDGPVAAAVLKVVDGDTLLVEAMPWPEYRVRTYVRLRGIDAPELRSKCEDGRRAAQNARAMLETLTEDSQMVMLSSISGDKYFGRVIATVTLADGSDASDILLSEGFAGRYEGGKRAGPKCSTQYSNRN